MTVEMPSLRIDPAVERAIDIVVSYLERKYGEVQQDHVERAMQEIYTLYRRDVRHSLLLADRAITMIENLPSKTKAA